MGVVGRAVVDACKEPREHVIPFPISPRPIRCSPLFLLDGPALPIPPCCPWNSSVCSRNCSTGKDFSTTICSTGPCSTCRTSADEAEAGPSARCRCLGRMTQESPLAIRGGGRRPRGHRQFGALRRKGVVGERLGRGVSGIFMYGWGGARG